MIPSDNDEAEQKAAEAPSDDMTDGARHLLELGAEIAELLPEDVRFDNHGDLYGDDGLPQ
ncbi:hypothetical protein Br6_05025 [Rhodococcus sp. Br-6]|nr:hypothetical protein Br6_05025 [Rhodococcus sp. Br-6]